MSNHVFQLKEKAWTFKDTYEIKDHQGDVIFLVKGKTFSMSNTFFFQNIQERNLLQIKKKLVSFRPKYKIKRAGKTIAVVEKKWSVWKAKFKVDIPGPNDYTIEGKFWKREYDFFRKGKKVAEVSKKRWSWSDTYGVEIEEDEDVQLILATVVTIDLFLKELDEEANAETDE